MPIFALKNKQFFAKRTLPPLKTTGACIELLVNTGPEMVQNH
jgi:hypothetical protein